jgi:hypothetical protein
MWRQAQEAVEGVKDMRRASALRELAKALAQAGELQWAEQIAGSIEDSYERVEALRELIDVLLTLKNDEHALWLMQQAWLQAETRADALDLLPLTFSLIALEPEVGMAFFEGFRWVDRCLAG